MDALISTMEADTRRPTRTLPGAGGNTIGAPLTQFSIPASAATIGFGAGGPLLGGLGATMPTILAQILGRSFTNPDFVRSVAKPDPFYQPSDIGRAVVGGTGVR
jgi:hypothetical protein